MTAAALPTPTAAAVSPSAPGRAVGRLALRQIRRGALIVAAVCAGMSAIVAVQYQTTFQGATRRVGPAGTRRKPRHPNPFRHPGGTRRRRRVHRVAHRAPCARARECLDSACSHPHHPRRRGRRPSGSAASRSTAHGRRGRCAAWSPSRRLAVVISAAVGAGLVAAGTDTDRRGHLRRRHPWRHPDLRHRRRARRTGHADPVGRGRRHRGLALRLALRCGCSPTVRRDWRGRLDDPVRPHRACRAVRRQPGRPAAGARRLSDRVRGGRVGDGAPSRCGQRLGRGGDEPSTANPAAGVRYADSRYAARFGRRSAGRAAIVAYFLLVGALIASILEFFDTNHRFADMAAGAGFAGLDSANGFAAALFSLLAIPTGLYATTRLAAMVADERARRWTPVFAAECHEFAWCATRSRRLPSVWSLLHVFAGLAIWAGASITGAPLSIGAGTGRRAELGADRLARGRRCRSGSRLATIRSRSHRCAAGGRRVSPQRRHPEAHSHRIG